MPLYRIWPSTSGGPLQTDSTSTDLGQQFKVAVSCVFDGYWQWVPTGGPTTGSQYSFRLYSTTNGTTGTLITGTTVTGSGTLTANAWNWVPVASPVQLTGGTTYVATITYSSGANHYPATASYWSGFSITNGPLTAPSTASALGGAAGAYNEPSTGGMPVTAVATTYWLDVQVDTGGAIQVPQSVSLLQRGMATPGNFCQWVPYAGPPPQPQPAAAATLLRSGLVQQHDTAGTLTDYYTATYTSLYGGPETPGAAWQQTPQVPVLLLQRFPVQPQAGTPAAAPPPPQPGAQPQQSLYFVQHATVTQPQSVSLPAAPPPQPAPEQAPSLVWRGIPQQPHGPAIPPRAPPGQQPQHALDLLLQRLPATAQSPAIPVAAPAAAYAAGQPQQALSLMLQGLPVQPQSPAPPPAVPPVVPLPGQPQATSLLYLGLPVPGNWNVAPATVPPVVSLPGQPQPVTLIRLGLPVPGNWYQQPYVPPPPSPQNQPAQAVTLLRLGVAAPVWSTAPSAVVPATSVSAVSQQVTSAAAVTQVATGVSSVS